MEERLLMDASTISKLNLMAGIDPLELSRSQVEAKNRVARFELARLVLEKGCQAKGMQDVCTTCSQLNINPPMCQRRNATMEANE